MNVKASRLIAPLALALVLLAVWELAIRQNLIASYLLPAPTAVGAAFAKHAGSLAKHAALTLSEALAGLALANLLSFGLAVAFVHSGLLERAVMPWAIALKTTPIIAIAPLLVVWFGTGPMSKICAAALICFFPTLVSATAGLRDVQPEALDLFETLSASRWQVFTKLRLPSCVPHVFSALKISSSLAIVGAVVGEFVGANAGLGYVILTAYNQLELPLMFAAVACAAAGGITLFALLSALEARLLRWRVAAPPGA
jgi:NitT/TauT family transport system permease protein